MLAEARTVGRAIWTVMNRSRLITAGVGVNLLLIFLPFYDWNNIVGAIALVGGNSNTGPTLATQGWPAGFFFLAPFTLVYLTYMASGFQLYWVAVVAKIAAFGFTGATAWLLFRIGGRSSPKLANGLAAFVLLNPVLLYINYVWVNWDLYPIFFLFLGYFVLRYRPFGQNDHVNLRVATAALMVSVLFYWYALVAIPIFLIYSRTGRERAWLLTYCILFFGVLIAVGLVFFGSSPLRNFIAVGGGSPDFTALKFFGLPYYVLLGFPSYVALVGTVVLVLPLVLRRYGVSEPAALFAVLLLLIWTSPVQIPDNYSWVFWFTPLVFLAFSRKTISWPAVGLSMALPLMGVVVASLVITNGQADGQGILYFGYDLFHSNYQFFPTPASRSALLAFWNAVALIGVVASIGLVLYAGWRAGPEPPSTEPLPKPDVPERAPVPERSPPVRVRWYSPRRAVIAVALVMAIAVSAGAFNFGLPNLLNYQGSGPLPTLALDPIFVIGNSNPPRPIPQETYGVEGSRVTIFPAAPPLGFIANPVGRTLSANLSFALSGLVPTDVTLAQTSSFNLSLLTLWSVDEARTPTLPPRTASNVSNGILGYKLMNTSPQVLSLGLTSDLSYSLNSTTLSTSYLFWSYQFTRSGGQPVPVFELTTSNGHASLVSYPDHATLTYGSGASSSGGNSVSNPYSEISRQWSFVGIHESGNEFWMDFNGVVEIVAAPWAAGNATLRLGQTLTPNGPLIAPNQRVSPIHLGSFGPGPTNYSFLNWTWVSGAGASTYSPATPLELQYEVQSGPGGTQASADGDQFITPRPVTAMFFGKGSPGNYSVVVTIHQLVIHEPSPGYYLIPAFLAVVGLYTFPAWAWWRMRATPAGDRAPTDA